MGKRTSICYAAGVGLLAAASCGGESATGAGGAAGSSSSTGTATTSSTAGGAIGGGGTAGAGGVAAGGGGAGLGGASAGGAGASSTTSSTGAGGSVALPWTRHFGGPGDDYPARIGVGPNDEIALLTKFGTSIDLGTGALTSPDSSLAIAKLDAAGNTIWSRAFTSMVDGSPIFVRFDAQGSIFLGANDDDLFGDEPDFGGGPLAPCGATPFFVKLDAAGNHVWGHAYGDCAGQSVADGVVDSAGNLIVVGAFTGTIDFGSGPMTASADYDAYVAKLDSAGNGVWGRQFTGAKTQAVNSIALAPSDGVVVAGVFNSSITIGTTTHNAVGYTDGFVAMLDAAGNRIWSRSFGVPDPLNGLVQYAVVASDAQGGIILTGGATGSVDLGGGPSGGASSFVARYDSAGNFMWNHFYGSNWNDVGLWPAVLPSGDIALAGGCIAPVDLGTGTLPCEPNSDVALARFTSGGAAVWAERDGDSNYQGASTPLVDGSGNVVVLTAFQVDLPLSGRLGTATYQSAGAIDLALGKFSP